MRFLLFVLMLPVLLVAAMVGAVFVPFAVLLAPIFPGLAVLRRAGDQRTLNLLSYHSPHSLTWSWVLSLQIDRIAWNEHANRLRFGLHPYRTNQGLQIAFLMPWLCLQWHRQQPTFYREMWRRQRDLADGLT
ncbi:MAG: hypothetical protein WBF99_12340 [Xanthobacteraceae bacterium]